jgi:aminopeptidase N
LKEGLTVFRDQEFSSDLNSRAVQRIDDVTHLRRHQFIEDSSPLAHPVRPESYIEINNFYTMTIYEKGAEVIRMFHTLLGPELYRKATDLYFDRYDGKAVTIDDWAQCMMDASGLNLEQFKLWYSQAGTPKIKASGTYNEDAKTYTLTLEQKTPDTAGQKDKKPMHIPVAFGLVGANGDDVLQTKILDLKEAKQEFTFENIKEKPVPSILRGFSAPVTLTSNVTDEDLAFLMVHDNDGFNQWEAGQKLVRRVINKMFDNNTTDVPAHYIESLGDLVDKAAEPDSDKALMARAMSLPSISEIGQSQDLIDPTAINNVRKAIQVAVREAYLDKLVDIYKANTDEGDFSITPEAMGKRALRNVILGILTSIKAEGCSVFAKAQYDNANNMTDRLAAFNALIDNPNAPCADIIQDFYDRYSKFQLVIDKWFGMQASANHDGIFDALEALRKHPDFDMTNPNRVRSLFAAFAMNNPVAFHDPSGRGYDFLKNAIIELNEINPQIAARMVTPLREWKRYTPDRQEKMKTALQDILEIEDISPNVYELVSKSLG